MNAETIAIMARQGQNPPAWQVYRARPAFFRNQILLGVLILALGAVGAIYLLANPLIAFVPGFGSGSQSLDPGPFMIARTVDFVVIALLLLIGVVSGVNAVRNLTQAHDQVLVLMPEGFVLCTKSATAYPYATMRGLNAASYRGTITLTIADAATQQRQRVRLDGRFGNARQLAGRIMAQRTDYLAARARAQPPSPGSGW
jgi:hypothetical protein